MGGVAVMVGFLFGVMSYIAITANDPIYGKNNLVIMGILCSLLITTIIGMVDDILGWKVGLRQYQKPLLTLLAVIPIAVLISGHEVFIPFIGTVDFGIAYFLLIVPIVMLITTNGFNMLAGYNGLEAGMGIIILTTLGFMAFSKGNFWAGATALLMVFALIGFLVFNFYPAKVFPGDSMTYSVGALIGIVAIVAHLEHVLLILFIPYAIEFFLKLRGRFQKESFSKLRKNGTLYVNQIYGIEHVMVRLIGKFTPKVTERKVVAGLWLMQIIFAIITWMVFR
jgi:UDP-N-acetylglucosamine--dolichyl-phosphate N-acetylglucosaminephosphotransferase